MIRLDSQSKTPLYEQVYEQVRQGIIEGVYAEGSRLPSIRGLAERLHCSRNTVETAYRLLAQEDLIESRTGSGVSVKTGILPLLTEPSSQIPAQIAALAKTEPANEQSAKPQQAEATELSDASKPSSFPSYTLSPALYDFTYGNQEAGTFPAKTWKRLTDDVLMGFEGDAANCYTDSAGEKELRSVIATKLNAMRGIHCTPEQVVIQGGTQASIQNLLLLFDPATDKVAMEEPGYAGVRSAIESSRFEIAPIAVYPYESEPFLQALRESDAKLFYCTPSNQFPTGRIMELETRDKLCAWATETGTYIIEDDYCFEYNYKSQPIPSLKALDTRDCVIYLGTFSKSVSPALRISYLVLPEPLLKRWQEVFCHAYPAVSWLSQKVLARYLKTDQRARHLRRLQVRNRHKYEALSEAIEREMGSRVEVLSARAGLHLLVNVKDGRSQGELIALARQAGVRVYGTDDYWIEEDHPLKSCVLIGFSAIPLNDIEPGISALAHAWFD